MKFWLQLVLCIVMVQSFVLFNNQGSFRSMNTKTNAVKVKNAEAGVVIRTSSKKTIMVAVLIRNYHPRYKIMHTRVRKRMVHDEHEIARVGDIAKIVPCRPMSKRKFHKLHSIIKRNFVVGNITMPLVESDELSGVTLDDQRIL